MIKDKIAENFETIQSVISISYILHGIVYWLFGLRRTFGDELIVILLILIVIHGIVTYIYTTKD